MTFSQQAVGCFGKNREECVIRSQGYVALTFLSKNHTTTLSRIASYTGGKINLRQYFRLNFTNF